MSHYPLAGVGLPRGGARDPTPASVPRTMARRSKRVGAAVFAALVVTLSLLASAARAGAAIEWQTPEQIPSPPQTSAWFPDLAVDSRGRVHVVWCQTDHVLMKRRAGPGEPTPTRRFEQIYYAVRERGRWSAPRPIALPQMTIYRNAIAVDTQDRLSLLFNYTPGSGYDIYYRQARADDGFSAGGWEMAQPVNFRWNSYMSDLAAVGDTLHVVFDDAGSSQGDCAYCADIYYRRSTDNGATWSPPVSLRPSATGSARARIVADPSGVLHVSWDEGWDRNSGRGSPGYGVYRSSPDGGATWSEPTLVRAPVEANAQLAAAGDGRGGVLLVWRSTDAAHDGIYFQWSTDWGATWSDAQPIPGIRAGGWRNPFDRYALVADRAERIHLLAGGVAAGDESERLYHLEWDGREWSAPAALYSGPGFAQYPHLVIEPDGHAHATWFVRAAPFGEAAPHQIWYARGRLADAPAAAPPLALAYTRALAPAATPVPYPTPGTGRHRSIDWPKLRVFLACVAAGTALIGLTDVVGRLLRRRRAG